MSLEFTRQTEIFNPDNQKSKIIVIGAGSTGSFITLNLAKLGFNDISVVDYDEVEGANIPNQFYREQDIGKKKTEALKEIIKDFTGTDIKIIDQKIESNTMPFDIDLNTIIIFCLDNMEARKIIYEAVKDIPIKLIDTRMGGEGFQIYGVDLDNENDKEKYEKTLNAEIKETACGEKSVIYTILSIASETCQIVKQIDKQESNFKTIKREMKSLRIIGK